MRVVGGKGLPLRGDAYASVDRPARAGPTPPHPHVTLNPGFVGGRDALLGHPSHTGDTAQAKTWLKDSYFSLGGDFDSCISHILCGWWQRSKKLYFLAYFLPSQDHQAPFIFLIIEV